MPRKTECALLIASQTKELEFVLSTAVFLAGIVSQILMWALAEQSTFSQLLSLKLSWQQAGEHYSLPE